MTRTTAGRDLIEQSIERTRQLISELMTESASVSTYINAMNRAPALRAEEAILARLIAISKNRLPRVTITTANRHLEGLSLVAS